MRMSRRGWASGAGNHVRSRDSSVPAKKVKEGLSGIRLFIACYLLRSSLGDDSATAFAAFGAKINNPVGVTDYIKVMLDDDNGIAQVGEPVQDVEQFFYIVEMQSCGGLVQQVKS